MISGDVVVFRLDIVSNVLGLGFGTVGNVLVLGTVGNMLGLGIVDNGHKLSEDGLFAFDADEVFKNNNEFLRAMLVFNFSPLALLEVDSDA